ncbi:hypothetical protein AEA09_07205 [Lysinibacillus contaminans]|uniref:Tyr recombinase domain-containing protein n=1 Tax=Lysinibacillus contaminans TaxID=1293441 RepID=A0ABR5K0U1_9BACI|nr:hypothetical protein AEA09_07205 [Lysinibacillus contaminans]
MFAYAKEIGLIEINPVEASFVPKKKLTLEDVSNEETAKLYLETNELKEFLSYVDKHRNIMYLTLFYTIAFTGRGHRFRQKNHSHQQNSLCEKKYPWRLRAHTTQNFWQRPLRRHR